MLEPEVKVKSLYKALKVLECFTAREPELGITEISDKLGIYKSNVHNIVTTFEKTGYIEKNPGNGKYRLGLKILELAYIINFNISIREIVVPYMQEIANKANETVYFGIPREGQVLYLDSAYPRNSSLTRSMLGEKAPMYCTAIGKAMLAWFDNNEIMDILSQKVIKFTDNTITDPELLIKEMKEVRERGYAVDNMEHEYGIKCIGKAILNRNKQVIAALSISGPSLRFTDVRIMELAELLSRKIQFIEERLQEL
jgi:IclR family KDG regulon transcriptional repressor